MPLFGQLSENVIVGIRVAATLIVGASAAFSISILTSGQLKSITSEASIAFASLIIIQSLCVTLAKVGLDSSIVALLSRRKDVERRYILPTWFKHYVLLVTTTCALGAAYYFSSWELGACLLITTLLDTFAVLKIAELTAKRQVFTTLVANMLRHPFLLATIAVTATITTISLRVFSILYLVSALARFIYLMLREHKVLESVNLDIGVGLMAAQQILNFLVFRIDQLTARIVFENEDSARRFLYFMSYSDMTLVGVASVGGIIFPQFLQHLASITHTQVYRSAFTTSILMATGIGLGFTLYASFFVGRSASVLEAFCIITAATVGSHVNFQAFLAYRSNNLRVLVFAQAAGLCVALILLLMIKWFAYDFLLYTICPIALTVTSMSFWKKFNLSRLPGLL